jgi:hypothetical protein
VTRLRDLLVFLLRRPDMNNNQDRKLKFQETRIANIIEVIEVPRRELGLSVESLFENQRFYV